MLSRFVLVAGIRYNGMVQLYHCLVDNQKELFAVCDDNYFFHTINQRCQSHKEFTIVGRSTNDRCLECCARDGCNKELCAIKAMPGIARFWFLLNV